MKHRKFHSWQWVRFPVSLWPSNIKNVCSVKWCFTKFGPDSEDASYSALPVVYNVLISNIIYPGKRSQRGDIERIVTVKPELWRMLWIFIVKVTSYHHGTSSWVSVSLIGACGGSSRWGISQEHKPHCGLWFPHKVSGEASTSSLWWSVIELEGMEWSYERGGSNWVSGKDSSSEGGLAPHGNGHTTNPASIQELPGQCSQMYDLVMCGAGNQWSLMGLF